MDSDYVGRYVGITAAGAAAILRIYRPPRYMYVPMMVGTLGAGIMLQSRYM